MGAEVTPGGLRVMAADLYHLSDRQIAEALARCRRELKSSNGFAPKLVLGDILAFAGLVMGDEAVSIDAVGAWDAVVGVAARFGATGELRRHVEPPLPDCPQCHATGTVLRQDEQGHNWASPCPCKVVTEPPAIPQRILDTVARMGGWSMFYDIPTSAYPFRRRDFMAEYSRWEKVETQLETWRALGSGSAPGMTGLASELAKYRKRLE